MIIQEEFILECPHAYAWEFLSNFPAPIEVMPGVVEVKEQAPQDYVGAAKVHIGPFTFLFTGNMKITLVDHKACKVNITGGATDGLLGAHFAAKAYTQTFPLGANRSRVTITVDVGLGGMLGKLGWWMLKPKARQVVDTYARAVSQEIRRQHNLPIHAFQAAVG
jgi:carbon monoxide dehydrogenase subunit G